MNDDDMRQERIRKRAYRIWEEKGRPESSSDEDWQRAKREIDAEDDAEARPDRDPGEPSSPALPADRPPRGDPSVGVEKQADIQAKLDRRRKQ